MAGVQMIFWRALELIWAFLWLCLMGYAVYRIWLGRRMAKALRDRMEAGEAQRVRDTINSWRNKPKQEEKK